MYISGMVDIYHNNCANSAKSPRMYYNRYHTSRKLHLSRHHIHTGKEQNQKRTKSYVCNANAFILASRMVVQYTLLSLYRFHSLTTQYYAIIINACARPIDNNGYLEEESER